MSRSSPYSPKSADAWTSSHPAPLRSSAAGAATRRWASPPRSPSSKPAAGELEAGAGARSGGTRGRSARPTGSAPQAAQQGREGERGRAHRRRRTGAGAPLQGLPPAAYDARREGGGTGRGCSSGSSMASGPPLLRLHAAGSPPLASTPPRTRSRLACSE
ncbi:unnamed protein product [Urochloa humidicola]